MRYILWAMAALLLAASGLPARAAGDEVPVPDASDVVLGKADAPITIYEYASLTCPHCAEFDAETFPKVKAEWIDTGKAKLVFRDYPLDQAALKAAMVARCAASDQFFNFIDVLFKEQRNWATGEDPTEALSHIARLGGISQEKFESCMKDDKLQDRIVGERLLAQNQYGVESTPTFFVNGKKVVGALPYAEFVKVLSAAAADAGTGTRLAASPPRRNE